ncbi:Leucine Rich Repeat [Novymonas esmeraldas]|uniref:Leucine Rich Repeat n=1 Tax=Novymonas esmeraldas TaxID=1808958 RepID=A0AAW0EU08_9TRYP
MALLTAQQTRHTIAFLRQFPESFPGLQLSWVGAHYCGWDGVHCHVNGSVSIDLRGHDLDGAMPYIRTHIINGAHVMVVSIDLSNNTRLRDSLEPSWGSLVHLRHLDLSYTRLSGSIPSVWNKMRSLRSVRIAHTLACRDLPQWSIDTLESVDVSHNNLRGTLAESWSSMRSLRHVDLSGNNFCGCVPDSWATHSALLRAADNLSVLARDTNACRDANMCSSRRHECTVDESSDAGVAPQGVLASVGPATLLFAALALMCDRG